MVVPYQPYFRNKKITLLGLGLLGRGVGDAKFLAECGADLVVTDLKTEKELAPSLRKLKQFKNIKFVLGEHRLEDFRNRDLIVFTSNPPLDSAYLAEARKNNIPIRSGSALFAELSGAKIIGVTGTRGKSTTTQLIYEILKTAKHRVHLGGNVKGVSTLALLKKVKPDDWAVLELDSWQLQGFGEAKISPHIAVFTNFMPDHMNYYQGDMKRYRTDKENIFKFQKPGDRAVRGWELKPHLPRNWKVKLVGEHNLKNIACAMRVAEILGIDKKIIKQAVENFAGIPGRLELVRTVRGIKIYNDTTSTTPDALKAALQALGSKKKVILIAGGADKNLDVSRLEAEINKYCKKIIWLPGTGTDKVGVTEIAPDLKLAVQAARAFAKKNDIILFSPGFASFGLFKNEFDRGEQFNKIVRLLR